MKNIIKEVFTDINGKVSSKRVAFPISLLITVALIIMQGTEVFTMDVQGLIQTMIVSTYALLGLSIGERFKNKIYGQEKEKK